MMEYVYGVCPYVRLQLLTSRGEVAVRGGWAA